MTTYHIYYCARGGESGMITVERERKPSWAEMAKLIPGFVTARVVLAERAA